MGTAEDFGQRQLMIECHLPGHVLRAGGPVPAARDGPIDEIPGDFLYPGFVSFDYNGEWLETDRAPVVDPFGFCSLASLAFPPTGAARAAFRCDPGCERRVGTPGLRRLKEWVRNCMSETSPIG